MSKVDEAKLNQAMKTIADYFQAVSELSLKTHQKIAEVIENFQTIEVGTVINYFPSDIPNFFPDPYSDLLRMEDHDQFYEVYPIKFLGTDNFKEVSDIVRKLGGSYVHGDKAQGVKAHFTIPKGEPKP